jgi:hypothetical protein
METIPNKPEIDAGDQAKLRDLRGVNISELFSGPHRDSGIHPRVFSSKEEPLGGYVFQGTKGRTTLDRAGELHSRHRWRQP